MEDRLLPCQFRSQTGTHSNFYSCDSDHVRVDGQTVTAEICSLCRYRESPSPQTRSAEATDVVAQPVPDLNLPGASEYKAVTSDPQRGRNWRTSASANDVVRDCDAIVKSFRRFESLLRLVRSLRHFYPGIRIHVADDSFEDIPADASLPSEVQEIKRMDGVHWHQLPFDTGLSGARNYLVKQCTKPFILNLDDDFVVTSETKLEHMLTVFEAEPDLGVVAGLIRQDGRVYNWAGHLRFVEEAGTSKRLRVDSLRSTWHEFAGIRYRRTDLALNAFVARRDALLCCPWDENLKIVGEHLDHFLSMHHCKVPVAYTPDVVFGHLHSRPSGYMRFRSRKGEFVPRMLSKWGLEDPPNHLMRQELGHPVRSVTEMWRRLHDPRENFLVFGVGHSGTTIATKMLIQLGWNAGSADRQYAEHVGVRRLNEQLLKTGRFDANRARQLLEEIPGPWVVKDPRLLNTLEQWRPVLEEYQPRLLWITRDLEAVKQSYRRRGESLMLRGRKSVEETFQLAEQRFREWPGAKLRVEYEQLQAAIRLFDANRHGHSEP